MWIKFLLQLTPSKKKSMSDQTDYRMLIEKYMTLTRFSNNEQTFVNMRSNYFYEKAGLSEQDMVTLRQD